MVGALVLPAGALAQPRPNGGLSDLTLPPPPSAAPSAPAVASPGVAVSASSRAPGAPGGVTVDAESLLAAELVVAAPEAERSALDDALRALLAQRPSDCMAALTVLAQERNLDLRGYTTAAVMFRLAAAAATQRVLPSREGAPPVAAPGSLPPPPSDVETLRRLTVALTTLVAQRQWVEARALYTAATLNRDAVVAPYMPLAVFGVYLRSLAGAEAARPALAPAQAYPMQTLSSVAGPLPMGPVPQYPADRAPGTIDSSEAVTLYVAGGTAGTVLGLWAGSSLAGERTNFAQLTLPLVGLAGGLTGAVLLDRRHSIRRGRPTAANTGLQLGLVAGLTLAVGNDWEFAEPGDNSAGHALLVASGLGLGIGYGLGVATDARPGSGAMVLTGGIYGWFVGTMMSIAADTGTADGARNAVIGEALGALGAMGLARVLEPTVGQTRWADLGMLLGAMLGSSLGTASDSDRSASGAAVGAILGAAAGGAAGLYLGAPTAAERLMYQQRSAQVTRVAPRLGVAPVRGLGGMVTLSL